MINFDNPSNICFTEFARLGQDITMSITRPEGKESLK